MQAGIYASIALLDAQGQGQKTLIALLIRFIY
jgi:hypothetical protein